jgi:hypothetical protein
MIRGFPLMTPPGRKVQVAGAGRLSAWNPGRSPVDSAPRRQDLKDSNFQAATGSKVARAHRVEGEQLGDAGKEVCEIVTDPSTNQPGRGNADNQCLHGKPQIFSMHRLIFPKGRGGSQPRGDPLESPLQATWFPCKGFWF